MDTLFLELLAFRVQAADYALCAIAPSREEVLRQAMELVGLELIDYDSFVARSIPVNPLQAYDPERVFYIRIEAYSTAYRNRVERAAARR